MRRLVLIFLAAVSGAAVYYAALGWGGLTHQFINHKTVYHLPNQMQLFVQDSMFFAAHASDADNRRVDGDTSLFAEGPRHFLDIDDYPNFRQLPRNLDTLIRIYGWERVKQNGTNPWATLWVYDSLVNQLRRGDWNRAKLSASDLGHYVGDAHQPLHNTVNYDGQLTGQRGIHSRYETTMLNNTYYQSHLFIVRDSISYVANRLEFVFATILHSNSYVDTVLQADLYAKAASGWNGSGSVPAAYYHALWARTRAITLEQVQRATRQLAMLWYSAWVDAGLITVTGISSRPPAAPAEFSLAQNYPNPFNPSTTISYVLPVGGTVSLTIYSGDGRRIAVLVDENQSAGEHRVEFTAPPSLASGIYFYHLRLGHFVQVKKAVLLK